MFAQMCNEAHGEYLWGPPSCLEMLLHFNFIFPMCCSSLSRPRCFQGEQKEKKFRLVNFSFESSKKSKIVTVSQESSIGVCQT